MDYDKILPFTKSSAAIICADGGVKHTENLGLTPMTIIGDLDSSPSSLIKKYKNSGTRIIEYKRNKDETDSELAVQYAIEHGFSSLHLFGVFGDRFDHSIATLLFLAEKVPTGLEIKIIHGNQIMYLVESSLTISGTAGETISLIPLQDCRGVTLEGFEYPLRDEILVTGTTRGVSNVLTQNSSHIRLHTGVLLVVHTRNT